MKIKSFEELMSGVGYDEPEDISDYPDISDEEARIRLQVFFNGLEVAEKLHKKWINNLSFQVNKKALECHQVKDIIQFYNERVGSVLDDFIF